MIRVRGSNDGLRKLTLTEDRDTWKRYALAAANDPRLRMCGVVIHSSWHDPVSCAFPDEHEGDHSWASIPALPPADAREGERGRK